MQFRLSNQAGVDRNGKTCTRAPLKMKRGSRKGAALAGGWGGSAPPHLSSSLTFSRMLLHCVSALSTESSAPPWLFFAPLFLTAPLALEVYLLPAAPRYPEPGHYCRLSENNRLPPLTRSLRDPNPCRVGRHLRDPNPRRVGRQRSPCSLVAPVFRIHIAMRKACNRKICMRTPLKIKRGVEGGRSPPRDGLGLGGQRPRISLLRVPSLESFFIPSLLEAQNLPGNSPIVFLIFEHSCLRLQCVV